MMSSSSSATVAVEKATSELLISPDWTMNIDICDSINSHQWQAKDVIKAVKKRLQHKNSKVQLLALTLLETVVKNCGDLVHFQIAERNVLGEMVKIVKKKIDLQVRDKILVLLDSWQEAFGGPGGKHPQYYWAYEELRRSGVLFPRRSPDAAPIFTPPVTHPTLGQAEVSYGMPSNSSRRLDETMATEVDSLSLSSLDSMRDVMELLNDMLRAVNPSDREAVKDEVIVDLVNRCRSNKKKLMQMLTATGDEELLGLGLQLNDCLQNLLAKHDAVASGSPIPTEVANLSPKPTEAGASSSLTSTEVSDSSSTPNSNHPAPISSVTRALLDEEDEEEDDFALLARRHSKPKRVPSENLSAETGGAAPVPVNTTSSFPADTTATPSNALALPDPPAPVKTSKEQDIIDFLSITLSTMSTSPQAPQSPSASNQSTQQVPAPPSTQGNPDASQTYTGNQGQVPNSYVAPWAQPQSQPLSQPQFQPQSQTRFQPRVQLQYSSVYPPPPWAATPGYFNSRSHLSGTNNMYLPPQANMPASYTTLQGARPLQPNNSFPSRGSNGLAMHGDPPASSGPGNPPSTTAQKPFIPAYRLFEDLNVLGSADAKLKMTSSSSPSLSGTSGQGMVGGRK